ncbi:lysophospholipid acyltransferase family protein [Sinimarinibacterium sp. NLF-5-8]|uniref:lysophospholipid acyltransferase family protein n=1 Tax=Sinimarinibacterium sp. NLF-5-8 TaxID=2698684 RepID=UPI00137BE269|nr:lysophospholipid acyltransferase family protein [Sinimarinibacterium sp. NLF-5-8]QHS11280.1 lysophospholipid acyltransferase family protein [Sinimarinibacterium sp. NLF-5-8]
MRTFFYLLAHVPLPILQGLGNVVGWGLWLIPNSRRRAAYLNIELCLPEATRAEQRRLVRRALCSEIKTILEMPVIWLAPEKRVLKLLRAWHGREVIDAALAQGKGLILLTLHQGNWEGFAIPFSKDYPATGLYKPQKGIVDALSLQGRCRFGGQMEPAVGGVGRAVVEVLNRGETVYFMPDQDPPPGRGVFAPFFGVPAHSPTLVAKLAHRTGAPVVFFYGERLSWGRGFVAHCFAAPDGIDSPDVPTAVAAMNAGLERCARLHPDQYWWGYKRFRRRPEGEPELY